MIRSIDGSAMLNSSIYAKKKLSKKKSNSKNLILANEQTHLIRPSVQHLKANFVSFKANNLPATQNNNYSEPVFAPDFSIIEDLSSKPKNINVNYANKLADQSALLLASGKDIKVNYKNGSMPELFAETFTNNLKNSNYEGLGFSDSNTDVIVYDAAAISVISPQAPAIHPLNNMLNSLIKKSIMGRKQVVFVKNMEEVQRLDVLKGNSILAPVFKSGSIKNINIIALNELPKKEANPMMGLQSDDAWLRDFKTLNLLPPSKKQMTELMLKEEFLDYALPEHRKGIGTLEIKAIDKVINITENQAGEYPKKAIDIARLAINQKLKENPYNNQIITVSANDVEKVFKNNPEFNEKIMSAGGQFEVIQESKVKLSDVGGIKGIKKEIQEDIIGYIENPDIFKKVGVKPPKGVLLSGPPGTGKTLLAKAIAGEAKVPFIAASGAEFIEKYVGVGAQRVRELFTLAKQEARKSDTKTAIVFIDEIDAIGGKRGGDGNGNSEKDQTINQLLTEMNGLKDTEDVNIITIAATNRPEMLDDALTRAGRFDLKVTVPNPASSEDSRLEILQIHAKKKPFKNEKAKQEILKEMASATSGCSGADLAEILNKAARLTVKPGRKSPFITINDMQEAKLQLKFGTISEIDEVKWSKDNTVAHEAGHAITSLVFNNAMSDQWKKSIHEIDTITLQPRGNFLGAVMYKPNKDNPEINLYSTMAKIVSGYGGLNAERERKGFNGAGVSQDLKSITNLAKNAVSEWGLGPKTGAISTRENPTIATMYSNEIKADIKLFTKTGYKISKKIVEFNKDFIEHYVDVYNQNSEKGGSNLSGKEFGKMYKEWIVDNNKEKSLVKLQKDIKETMKDFEGNYKDTEPIKVGFKK